MLHSYYVWLQIFFSKGTGFCFGVVHYIVRFLPESLCNYGGKCSVYFTIEIYLPCWYIFLMAYAIVTWKQSNSHPWNQMQPRVDHFPFGHEQKRFASCIFHILSIVVCFCRWEFWLLTRLKAPPPYSVCPCMDLICFLFFFFWGGFWSAWSECFIVFHCK